MLIGMFPDHRLDSPFPLLVGTIDFVRLLLEVVLDQWSLLFSLLPESMSR